MNNSNCRTTVKEGYASGHAYSTPYVLQATFLADKKIMFYQKLEYVQRLDLAQLYPEGCINHHVSFVGI